MMQLANVCCMPTPIDSTGEVAAPVKSAPRLLALREIERSPSVHASWVIQVGACAKPPRCTVCGGAGGSTFAVAPLITCDRAPCSVLTREESGIAETGAITTSYRLERTRGS